MYDLCPVEHELYLIDVDHNLDSIPYYMLLNWLSCCINQDYFILLLNSITGLFRFQKVEKWTNFANRLQDYTIFQNAT